MYLYVFASNLILAMVHYVQQSDIWKKYDYSLMLALCICNLCKITCKSVQNHTFLFLFLYHLIFINKIFALRMCSSFMHCQELTIYRVQNSHFNLSAGLHHIKVYMVS